MENLKMDELEIIVEESEKIIIKWTGKCKNPKPSEILTPYFNTVINFLKDKNKEIEMRFIDLDFMNSSTVPSIVSLTKRLNDNKIKTEIIYDKKSKWQTASFEAFNTIALSMEYISVVGK